MAKMSTTISFSAATLFELVKDDYEENLHDSLRAEITERFPNGLDVPIHFVVGTGQHPARH